jgi:hypothetical protein
MLSDCGYKMSFIKTWFTTEYIYVSFPYFEPVPIRQFQFEILITYYSAFSTKQQPE